MEKLERKIGPESPAQFRGYQVTLAKQAYQILKERGIVYLALEMRVGKTLVAMLACYFLRPRRVLFVTKLKAVGSILEDFSRFTFGYTLDVTNYEQLHKFFGVEYDAVIVDEAHSLGAFPRPSQRTEHLREIVGAAPLVLLSGTPSPESYSQLYHQFWISGRTPFAQWPNFYKWAHEFVEIKQKMINGMRINDYHKADREKVEEFIKPYFITYTQDQAGCGQEIAEETVEVPMKEETMQLVKALVKDRIVTLPSGRTVIADTAVKLQSKVHQLCSGTVITEEGVTEILDDSKARFIRERYQGEKLAIFYKYKGELEVLRQFFPALTDSPEDFERIHGLTFVSQIRSGAMGINLAAADRLIFFNIDFSSVLYWQARARLQAVHRTAHCRVDWLFSRGGIERKIYQVVLKKKDYTLTYFQKDFHA